MRVTPKKSARLVNRRALARNPQPNAAQRADDQTLSRKFSTRVNEPEPRRFETARPGLPFLRDARGFVDGIAGGALLPSAAFYSVTRAGRQARHVRAQPRRRRAIIAPSIARAATAIPPSLAAPVAGLNAQLALVVVFEPSLLVVVTLPFPFTCTSTETSMLNENSVAS